MQSAHREAAYYRDQHHAECNVAVKGVFQLQVTDRVPIGDLCFFDMELLYSTGNSIQSSVVV